MGPLRSPGISAPVSQWQAQEQTTQTSTMKSLQHSIVTGVTVDYKRLIDLA
jgi:hypothetical protein